MVACIRTINHQRYNPRMIKYRDYKNYDHNELCADMINIDWQPLYEILDVNKALDNLNNILGETFSKHAPLIEKRVKWRKYEWLTSELKRLLSERDKLLRKARRTKDPADWRAYKTSRNKCTNEVRHSKAKYHRNLLNEKSGDPKKFWDCINLRIYFQTNHPSQCCHLCNGTILKFVQIALVTILKTFLFAEDERNSTRWFCVEIH